MNRAFVALCIALFCAGCGDARPPDPAPLPVGAPVGRVAAGEGEAGGEAPGARATDAMAHHFEAATRARDALARGDLTSAQRAMAELALAESPPDVPALSGPSAESMRRAARAVAEARDLDAATRAFGDATLACGSCHTGVGADVAMPHVPAPVGEDLEGQMRRHLWALDRMWEGLIVSDEARFTAGAAALADVPLGPLLGRAGSVDETLRGLWDRVHELGVAASSAPDDAVRARVFGDLLRTCAGCHRHVGVGGPLAPIPL